MYHTFLKSAFSSFNLFPQSRFAQCSLSLRNETHRAPSVAQCLAVFLISSGLDASVQVLGQTIFGVGYNAGWLTSYGLTQAGGVTETVSDTTYFGVGVGGDFVSSP